MRKDPSWDRRILKKDPLIWEGSFSYGDIFLFSWTVASWYGGRGRIRVLRIIVVFIAQANGEPDMELEGQDSVITAHANKGTFYIIG